MDPFLIWQTTLKSYSTAVAYVMKEAKQIEIG